MILRNATLGHVVLNVKQLKKSEAFYRSILGMRVSGRNKRTKMSFLSFGREHHDIALMELPRGGRLTKGKGIPGLHHFCVYVGSNRQVESLFPVLRRKKIPIVSGPEILEIARNRSISFLDPDGNRVEVACNANKFKTSASKKGSLRKVGKR